MDTIKQIKAIHAMKHGARDWDELMRENEGEDREAHIDAVMMDLADITAQRVVRICRDNKSSSTEEIDHTVSKLLDGLSI